MPDLDVWRISASDRNEIHGVYLPESAEHIWRGKNCLTTMNTLMTAHATGTDFEGSLDSENMILEVSHVTEVKRNVEQVGEDSDKGFDEAREFIDLAKEHFGRRENELLVVGVWL